MRQSVSLQLFNFLYSKFTDLGVPVIRTSELNQELPYPFIAIQDIKDDINRLTLTVTVAALLQLSISGAKMMIKVRMMNFICRFSQFC